MKAEYKIVSADVQKENSQEVQKETTMLGIGFCRNPLCRLWLGVLGAPVGEGGASPLRSGDRRQRELALGSPLPPLARPRQRTARLRLFSEGLEAAYAATKRVGI